MLRNRRGALIYSLVIQVILLNIYCPTNDLNVCLFFMKFILSLYIVNLIFQWREEESHTGILALVSIGLTLIFVVEVVMKIIAFTPRGYWQSRRNRYDLLVTVLGVIWIFIHTTLHVCAETKIL